MHNYHIHHSLHPNFRQGMQSGNKTSTDCISPAKRGKYVHLVV